MRMWSARTREEAMASEVSSESAMAACRDRVILRERRARTQNHGSVCRQVDDVNGRIDRGRIVEAGVIGADPARKSPLRVSPSGDGCDGDLLTNSLSSN